jgi:hypothetical protein
VKLRLRLGSLGGDKNMNRLFLQLGTVILFGAVGVGTAAAQCISSNNFCLTGVGNGNNLYGIYVSPYVATINGVSTYVICDDFSDEVDIDESWTTTQYSIPQAATSGLFGSGQTSGPAYTSALFGYEEVAYLSQQLITGLPTMPALQQQALSYAIWSVFEPNQVQSYLSNYTGGTSFYNTYVAPDLTAAATNAASGSYSNVNVFRPVDGTETCCGNPQEFVRVSTPEAPSAANLGVDFLGFGVLLFAVRRYKFAGR